MAKPKNYGGLILLALLVIAGGAGSWFYFNGRHEAQPEFATTKVNRGDITQAVTATGDLQPVVTVDVGAQVSGQVKEVLVDFNSKVKAGDVLARIDPAPAQQRMRQAEADLASAKANNQLLLLTAERTRELFTKHLVSQSELDTANANLAQSQATLLTRTAAVENAKLDLDHCTITSPIDGMVLNRNTDPGRTVNSSMNAPVLFTLVNDLSKMQINAAVAEADVGSITDGQDVDFTVDAFPNRTFHGVVRQVRNAATTNQSVVSYATIIDVNNSDLRLKPGMTANVSIIIARKRGVLRVSNAALRARIPQELLPKAPAAPGKAAPAPMSPREQFAAVREIMTQVGAQRGEPWTPDQIASAKKLATDKGIDPEFIDRMASRTSNGGGRRRGSEGPTGQERGFSTQVTTRTLYKPGNPENSILPVSVRLGISDGVNTEVLSGLDDGDGVITSVTMPGATAEAMGGPRNPFQQGRGFGGRFGR